MASEADVERVIAALEERFGDRFEELGVVVISCCYEGMGPDGYTIGVHANDPRGLAASEEGKAMRQLARETVKGFHFMFCAPYRGGGVGGAPVA